MVPPRPTAKSRTLRSRGIATLRPGCAGRPGRHTSSRCLRSSRSQIARSGATWKTIGPRGPSPQPHFPFPGREKPTSRALACAAIASGDAKKAAQLLGAALQLWRGPPVVEWLEEARLAAVEERIDADLALGRHDRVVSELEELVAHHPFRERPRGQLMLALYRSGRQADALELYRRTRETLIEELGIEPSTELQNLEQAILRQDPSLERRRPPVPSAREPATRRRRSLVPIAVIVVLAVGATAAALLLSDRGGSPPSRDTELRAFVVKIENFLDQSRQGRRDVADTVSAAFDCRLAPHAAAVRLNRVQRDRQSLLQQVAALSVPASEDALLASDLLQKAGQASIAADWHYRDWLLGHRRCVPPDGSRELRAARTADVKATQTKQSFTSVFNPLARHFHQKTWRASEF